MSPSYVPRFLRRLRLAVAIASVASIGACSSSQSSLTNLWMDPEYGAQPMQSVYVVVIKRDAATRRIWEDGFVNQLQRRGVNATPSYRLFPNAAPDTEQVIQAVRDQGADGVLEVHQLPTETAEHYVPGYVTTVPVHRYNPWTGFYYTHYHDVYQPGYVETERVVRYEVNLWSIRRGGTLVWTGTTETIDPSSSRSVNRQISKLIVPELAHKGVIRNVKT